MSSTRIKTLIFLSTFGCAGDSTSVSDSATSTSTGSTPSTTTGTAPGTPGGTPSTGTTGSGTPSPTGVAMFVAQGHVQRTAVNCDDGNTWVADQTGDATIECWGDNWLPDCDHRFDSARGIAYGDGWFVATYGWGEPGGLFRSRDGVTWEETNPGSTAAGVAYGNGVFLAGDWMPYRSSDGGATWEQLPWLAGNNYNIRRTFFVDAGGGRFILANDGSPMISSDNGDSWTWPSVSAGCGSDMMFSGGFAYGNGVVVGVSGSGPVCVSSDDGATFTSGGDLATWMSSRLLFDGSQFVVWSPGQMHTSPDGVNWTTTAVSGGLTLDSTAVSDTGTYVGVAGWYADQTFYRSTDGVNWSATGGSAAGHPIYEIVFGHGDTSAECP